MHCGNMINIHMHYYNFDIIFKVIWQSKWCLNSLAGLAKSLARRPGAIVFSSRATKMYHRPARRATLNTGLRRNVPSTAAAQKK